MVKNDRINWVPVIIILLASFIRFLSPSANSLILGIVFPVLTAWGIYKQPNVLMNKYICLYIFVIIWLIIATFFSINSSESFKVMKSILGGLAMSILFYYLASKSINNGKTIMLSYVLMFVASLYYLYQSGELLAIDVTKERVEDEMLNANDLAYDLFYISIIVGLFNWDGVSTIKRKTIILYVSLVLVTLFLSIFTASRQVIVVVLPMIIILIFFRLAKRHQNRKLVIYGILLVIIGVVVYYYYMTNYYAGSYLETRMDTQIGEDSRASLIKKGFQVGLENPLFGVGPNCFGYYSGGAFTHCTYAELFATGGLLPMILFVVIIVGFTKLNYRRYKETNNRVFLYLFVSSLGWGGYQFFFVFHMSPWLISFYFLLMGYSDAFYKKIKYEQL